MKQEMMVNLNNAVLPVVDRPFLRYEEKVGEVPAGVVVDKSLQTKELDLDAKVKVDGKSFTVKELVEKANKADTLAAENAELAKIKEDVRLMYQADIDPAAGRAALERSLVAAGWKAADAKEEAAKTFGVPEKDVPKETPTPQPTMTDKVTREFVDLHIDGVCKEVTGSGELKVIVDGITKRDGAPAGKNVADQLKGQVRQELMTLMQQKRELEGTFKVRWINELSEKAAKIVADKAKVFTGDPKNLGKALNVGDDPLTAYLEKPPVAAPSFQPGKMSGGSLDRAMEEYIADGFLRAAATQRVGSGI